MSDIRTDLAVAEPPIGAMDLCVLAQECPVISLQFTWLRSIISVSTQVMIRANVFKRASSSCVQIMIENMILMPRHKLNHQVNWLGFYGTSEDTWWSEGKKFQDSVVANGFLCSTS